MNYKESFKNTIKKILTLFMNRASSKIFVT